MGNTLGIAKAERPLVTKDLVSEAIHAFQPLVEHQGDAVTALIGWLRAMSEDTNKQMRGSVCFAGMQGAAQQKTLQLLGELFWGTANIYEFDMRQYSSNGLLFQFFLELKTMAHGHNVIVFNHISRAHLEILVFINQLMQDRVVPEHYPSLPYYVPGINKLYFRNVIFVARHSLQGLAAQQTWLIASKAQEALEGSAFDAIVPFRCGDLPTSSSGQKDSVRTKRSVPDAPVEEGRARDQLHKRKKIHNTNMNSNNTTTTTTTSTSSHNPNSHNKDSLNTADSHNKDSLNTTTTNSYNSNSPTPLELTTNATNHDESVEVPPTFPEHKQTNVEAFVDGEEYFSRLYDEFTKAKSEILICGWMLSPVYLKRPHLDNEDSNLFKVLKAAAGNGVKVRILLREADSMFVVNKHKEYKNHLEHHNIQLALQSRGVKGMIFSHHQKFVIVDRSIGFVGGLDLAFNRWDTTQHWIVDAEAKYFPIGDYYHTDTKDILHKLHCRMGWHDVQVSVAGTIVSDLRQTFVERWNATGNKLCLSSLSLNDPTPRASSVACRAQIVRSIKGPTIGKHKDYVEQDILKAYCELITSAETFVYVENQYFILDIDELRSAIIARIKAAAQTQQPFIMAVVLPIAPDNGGVDGTVTQTIIVHQKESIKKLQDSLQDCGINADQYINFYALMNHDTLNGELVASQIYVHSKVMISDGMSVIGSANLNNRSLTGTGDSEIAVKIYSDVFSKNLVHKLLGEHSGEKVEGDICHFMAVRFCEIAVTNYMKYQNVFGQLESKNATAYITAKKNVRGDNHKQLAGVKGHVVSFPMNILENLTQPKRLSSLNPLRKVTG